MSTTRNTFISFSFDENEDWKNEVVELLGKKNIIADYSEKKDRSNTSDENIWKYLEKKIKGSSITLVLLSEDLIGRNGKGKEGNNFHDSGWIYKEISCSLRDWDNNRINGIIAIAKDDFYKKITYYEEKCITCNEKHTNYKNKYIPEIILKNRYNIKQKYKKSNCAFDKLEDSYISIVSWTDFKKDPEKYINNAFEKRERQINNQEFIIEYNLHK